MAGAVAWPTARRAGLYCAFVDERSPSSRSSCRHVVPLFSFFVCDDKLCSSCEQAVKWARSFFFLFFLPRCKSGYETCTEKVSLFAAPRETNRLKIWRHAIPRKDRVLQSTDYVCEKHFEPRYVTKMWEAVYKGLVLVSAPRKATLAKDAVPTKFPECPAHLTKTEKKKGAGAPFAPSCHQT
ncbi:hypothetical protein HPB49_019865 [Dermacentor silvarum]|uniref:Uncharacterized protein n=1 Tax=Dermacentor silvarum TaxID=543639 RepID=A0ACB8CH31_DERSI|nr:hypothetical protein HPB49_019865 [Dermacentor silvarum]